MADTKTTDLTALTGAGAASTDVVPVADVSATTLKKMTLAGGVDQVAKTAVDIRISGPVTGFAA